MSWALGEMAAFDIESTGVDVETARIVTATVARIVPNAAVDVTAHLVAVDVDIPAEATEVHGITTEHARANGKPAVEVLDAVAAHLAELMANGIPIVGMNVAFDFTLLDRELRRNNLPTLEDRLGRPIGPCVDVYVLDKAVDRYCKGRRKLTDMCATYGARIDGAHDATADALAAARIAYQMGRRASLDPDVLFDLYADRPRPAPHIVRAFQAVGRMSLAELHEAQKSWYREQSESFTKYLRQKANELEHCLRDGDDVGLREEVLAEAEGLRRRADDVCVDWPMRPWTGTN